ncbi:MAG: hypothetical protein ACRERC_01515, partial [Candidatus Binatia bacterium]
LALSVALIQIPTLARLLHLQPLHLDDWGLAVAGALLGGAAVRLRLRHADRARAGAGSGTTMKLDQVARGTL